LVVIVSLTCISSFRTSLCVPPTKKSSTRMQRWEIRWTQWGRCSKSSERLSVLQENFLVFYWFLLFLRIYGVLGLEEPLNLLNTGSYTWPSTKFQKFGSNGNKTGRCTFHVPYSNLCSNTDSRWFGSPAFWSHSECWSGSCCNEIDISVLLNNPDT
jgi:hypothetical protein